MNIVIINKRNSLSPGVYVGRPSPLGNPFRIGSDGSRKEVIQKYRQWLSIQLEDEFSPQSIEISRLVDEVKRCGILKLLCWCAPLPCHAEVIRDVIVRRVES